METGTKDAIRGALDRLWAKFLPEMEERLAVLKAANGALAAGALLDRQRTEAVSAAHKLAGTLGMFGLAEGTELAREAEAIYSGEREPVPEATHRLPGITDQIAELIRAHRR